MSRAMIESPELDRPQAISPVRPRKGTQSGTAAAHTLAFCCALSAAVPLSARADGTLNPYVDAQVEHDSNVFRVPNSQTILLSSGDPTLADTDEKYIAGVDGTYMWSQQKLTAVFEGRHSTYNHYKDLDHNEYLADVDLTWKLTHLFDGSFELRQERVMAPFVLGNSSRLTINVDRNAAAKVNFNVSPDWRLDVGGYYHKLNSPLQNFPDFVERDIGSHAGLSYVGIANLTYGIAFDHIDGRFENAQGVGPFVQNGSQLKLNYAVGTLTTLNAAVGYSKRDQAGAAGNISAFTGELGYTRQLTGKTSVNVHVTRAVNSYVAAGGSEIDTTAAAQVYWQATYKIAVTANYAYTHSTFIGQVIPGSITNGRVDRSPYASLRITYQPIQRLQFRAYLTKQSRTSNVELFNYSATIYGIDAKLTFR